MNVFVIGASGYIGTAVCEALRQAGHEVRGLSRSHESDEKLRAASVTPVRGSVDDPQALADAAVASDATIYTVQYDGTDGFAAESAALTALTRMLAPLGRTFIYTSGVWLYGSTGDVAADENAAHNPTPLVRQRPVLERIVLDAGKQGLRAIVIRPGDVYGRGGGIPAMWTQSAHESGAARVIGDGTNRWPMIYIDDLARLYVLALEKAPAGAVYNASGESFTVRELAEAASRGAGKSGAVTFVNADEARQQMGPFADALLLDSQIDAGRAQRELGWTPHGPSPLEDLSNGSYVS